MHGRVVILGQAGGWHERSLKWAFCEVAAEVLCLPITRLVSHVGGWAQSFGVSMKESMVPLRPDDTVIVRAIPGGSLEQVIYRMDALHSLQEWGCRVVNSAETIERSVDKFHASFLIQHAGIPTPRTCVAERFEDALTAYESLGGDIVLKPLFGSEGNGILHIDSLDLAYRTFRALDVTRSVFYMQERLPSVGWDLRVFVLAGRAVACIRRSAKGLKMNVSQGAHVEAYPMTEEIESLALRTAALFGADYCGVDIYPTSEGFQVIEINGIPGWRGVERATGISVGGEIAKWLVTRA